MCSDAVCSLRVLSLIFLSCRLWCFILDNYVRVIMETHTKETNLTFRIQLSFIIIVIIIISGSTVLVRTLAASHTEVS
jgi:hypothetical protein